MQKLQELILCAHQHLTHVSPPALVSRDVLLALHQKLVRVDQKSVSLWEMSEPYRFAEHAKRLLATDEIHLSDRLVRRRLRDIASRAVRIHAGVPVYLSDAESRRFRLHHVHEGLRR